MKYKRNQRLNKFGAWCARRGLDCDAIAEALHCSPGHAWKLMIYEKVNARIGTLRAIEEFTQGEITPTDFYRPAEDAPAQGELLPGAPA